MVVCRVWSRDQQLDWQPHGVILSLDLHFWEEVIDDDPEMTL